LPHDVFEGTQAMMKKSQIRRTARRMFRDCRVGGMLQDSRVRHMAEGARQAGGRDALALLQEFRHLIALEEARHEARVQSAVPLSEELHHAVESDLEQRYGKGLKTTFEEKPQLIAGMRIRVGNDIYDGSVRGRLAALESRF